MIKTLNLIQKLLSTSSCINPKLISITPIIIITIIASQSHPLSFEILLFHTFTQISISRFRFQGRTLNQGIHINIDSKKF